MNTAANIDEDDTKGGAEEALVPPKMSRADAADGLILDDEGLRHRRCIVTGEVQSESRLMRFVADPDGNVVPDASAKLPGRGLWVTATREAVTKAVEKKLFSRAAKTQVTATADLADRTEKVLVARILGDMGIARRGGSLLLGFDNVLRGLESAKPPKLLIEALDGSKDGKRKLYAAAHRLELNCVVVECLTSAELGLALGRENVIHAAVQPGGLAERLTFDAERLAGFRGPASKFPPGLGTERDS
ncbi:MAG TPA: RNA-binding protein [Rhizomicrobium sp.]|nr:RNA-binding protein [Rhizomicrobium sp.]